jgi:hypothetical protein
MDPSLRWSAYAHLDVCVKVSREPVNEQLPRLW